MDFCFIPPGEDVTENRALPDLSQCVRNEENEQEEGSLDHVCVMEDSQDLLATVMAEFSGTLKRETRDPKRMEEEEDKSWKLVENSVDACILDIPHHESPPASSSLIDNKVCDLQQSELSDTFCDEIFLELEKTSTFPRFSDWTLRGNELSGNFPSNNASR